MSYELSITRASGWPETVHWSESDCEAIAFDEWEAFVTVDPDLEVDYTDGLSIVERERLVDGAPDLAGCRTEDAFRFSKEQARRLKEQAAGLKGNVTPDLEEIGYHTGDLTVAFLMNLRSACDLLFCIAKSNQRFHQVQKSDEATQAVVDQIHQATVKRGPP